MKQAVAVRFEENGKETYFDPAGVDAHAGDYVMADTEHGPACGQVSREPGPTPDYLLPHPLRSLVRMADSVDIRRMHQRQNEDKKAWRICRECIERHGLEMKLVKVEYAPDQAGWISGNWSRTWPAPSTCGLSCGKSASGTKAR